MRTEDTKDFDGNLLESRNLHLMADDNGAFPISSLNGWEVEVLDKELARDQCLGWYRNPFRPSIDALAVAWQDGQGNWRRMCPDFIFFHGVEDSVKASIVDPHGLHLSDALPKLRGLAEFAEEYGDEFHRIEAVAKVGDELRVLDMMQENVRKAVAIADDPEKLYQSDEAANY